MIISQLMTSQSELIKHPYANSIICNIFCLMLLKINMSNILHLSVLNLDWLVASS